MDYRLGESFVSINGEGPRAGALALFLRFPGCNLDCSYCDTGWVNQPGAATTQWSLDELLAHVKKARVPNVTVTGGEPLLQPGMKELLRALGDLPGLHVEVETNGSVSLEPFHGLGPNVSFTMDYKLPSSGMEENMLRANLPLLGPGDALKFVCGSREDLMRAKEILEKHPVGNAVSVYLSPVYGAIEAHDMVEFMKTYHLSVKLQLQLHKHIWPPEMRGV